VHAIPAARRWKTVSFVKREGIEREGELSEIVGGCGPWCVTATAWKLETEGILEKEDNCSEREAREGEIDIDRTASERSHGRLAWDEFDLAVRQIQF
jgi:hypothetical protein